MTHEQNRRRFNQSIEIDRLRFRIRVLKTELVVSGFLLCALALLLLRGAL